jgi:ankyrin repeat protein
LDAGANTVGHNAEGTTPFLAAAAGGHSTTITVLLDQGGEDIDQGTVEALFGENGQRGATALILAALCGHVEAVTLLLRRGADVNKVTDEGYTSMCGAAGGGHVEVLKILLARGVDVNKADNAGETPCTMRRSVDTWRRSKSS